MRCKQSGKRDLRLLPDPASVGLIDWKLLREQKEVLARVVCSPRTPQLREADKLSLDGILYLLDALQDSAALAYGDHLIFGKPKD